ncbi:ATP-binding cassette domain-containing protein [Halobellus sp. GM3]|uniref:ATP-binding cassette domain-containing protein n=1 Tax=Halobellus sp. GM3 TaxID=3458410 RepID=UPI00403DFADF
MSSSQRNSQQEAPEYRVRVSGLKKEYQSGASKVVALEDFDLSVADNEFFCLLGPSGCGKSTMLRIVSGLLSHEAGEVDINASNRQRGGERPLTNMVFQEHGIFPWKSVLNNVAFGLKMRGVPKDERHEIANEYIEKVNLSGFEDSYPHQLSGGMKQRVGIARALANDPEILLMDEPFGALDAQTKEQLQQELLDLWSESQKTAIYVTHDIEEAILLGDRLGVMTARPGSVKEILENPLERPRTQQTRNREQFGALRDRVWNILSDEVQSAQKVSNK